MGAHVIAPDSFLAQSVLTKFRAVKGGTLDQSCTAVTAATDLIVGVVQHDVVTADINKQVANVVVIGVSKMEAGGTVTRFTLGNIDSSGRIVTAGAAGTKAVGLILESGVIGDWVDVLLSGPAAQVT